MRRWRRFLKPMLDTDLVPLLFIVGAILLGVIGNGVYDWVSPAGPPLVVAASALAVFLAIVGLFWLILRIARRRTGVRVALGESPPRKALIGLVSIGGYDGLPVLQAIKHHLGQDGAGEGRLTHCYLIASRHDPDLPRDKQNASWLNAVRLQEAFRPCLEVCEVIEVNPEDCDDVRQRCAQAWQRARQEGQLPTKEIVADLTGGTKLMTIGMLLFALESGCQVQYMQAKKADPKTGRPLSPEADARLVDLRFFFRYPWEEPLD